jgi:hypothetical protein
MASGGKTRWPVVLSHRDVSYKVRALHGAQYQHLRAGDAPHSTAYRVGR